MPNEVYDFLASFKDGMNSGVDPMLLPKSQLAFAYNATLRGDFFRQRAAFNTINLSYDLPATLINFQTGLFQGADYYKPDTGAESIVLQIGGHQFLATPDNNGNGAVAEITIPNDPDSPNQPQAWICQAENFLIFNNGLELPVFYDGAASRRSQGASQPLETVSIAAVAPAVGSSIPLFLNTPYTGPLNESIYIGDATYVVTAINGQSSVLSAVLENLYDPSTTQPAGTNLTSIPSQLGIPVFVNDNVVTFNQYNVQFITVGSQLTFSFNYPGEKSPIISTVTKVDITTNGPIRFHLKPGVSTKIWKSKTTTILATCSSYNGPTPIVGSLLGGFVVPTVGSQVTTSLNPGAACHRGDIVWIGTGQYKIISTSVQPVPTNTNITVENITDTLSDPIPIGTQLSTLPELPAGRALAYGMGLVCETMTDGVSFLYGDPVDSFSGSPQYNYRDAVLKITQNDFIAGGGLFRVPGSAGDIKAMQFCALLDVSLGQGPLQIFTPNSVFGCQVPVNRTNFASLTNPILTESLISAGGTSQNSVALANGDILFRSSDGFIRSLLMARLDFDRWSNTPISREMARVLNQENNSLLMFSTAAVFDNRFLMGTGLTQSDRGVFSNSLIALNFDPVSSLRGTDESIYDGQWAGLNVLQLVSGFFSGASRCFAICLSQDLTQIEIHEILPSDTPTSLNFDDGDQPIPCVLESPTLDFGDRKKGQRNYHRLSYGEIYVDSIVGPVQFQAFYKPDQWPNWVPWYSWTQTYTPNTDPGFRPRIGLPMPDGTVFDTVNNRPLREGFWFQFKLVATGPYRFLGARFVADTIPQPEFAVPVYT
jgi:hypothetical protein